MKWPDCNAFFGIQSTSRSREGNSCAYHVYGIFMVEGCYYSIYWHLLAFIGKGKSCKKNDLVVRSRFLKREKACSMKKVIRENKLLMQFMIFSVVGGMGMGVAQMAITLYAIELGATAAQIGLIGGVQGVGLLLTVLPIGILVDHVGPRKVFITGALTSAILYLLFPFARTSNALLCIVALLGFFAAFRFIPMTSVFLEFVRMVGSEKAGWQRGSHSFGLVFLGPLCGASISKYFGFNVTFYFVSASVVPPAYNSPAIPCFAKAIVSPA